MISNLHLGQRLSTRRQGRLAVIRPPHPTLLTLASGCPRRGSSRHIRICPVISTRLITCITVRPLPRRPKITTATTTCSCWLPPARPRQLSGPVRPAIIMDLNVRCTVKTNKQNQKIIIVWILLSLLQMFFLRVLRFFSFWNSTNPSFSSSYLCDQRKLFWTLLYLQVFSARIFFNSPFVFKERIYQVFFAHF